MDDSDLPDDWGDVERRAWRLLPETKHRTVFIEQGDESADVDEQLAPLVLEIWRAGWFTTSACQDIGQAAEHMAVLRDEWRAHAERNRGIATISFEETYMIAEFIEALANMGPRDAFYDRLTHHAAVNAWTYHLHLDDWGIEEGDALAPDGTRLSAIAISGGSVHFPRTDIGEALRRMQRHNAGEPVDALGDPTYETASFPDDWVDRVLKAHDAQQ